MGAVPVPRDQLSSGLDTMDAVVVGAAFVGSMATAFVLQKAILGAMLRVFRRDKAAGAVATPVVT
jgi:hypothetical protein